MFPTGRENIKLDRRGSRSESRVYHSTHELAIGPAPPAALPRTELLTAFSRTQSGLGLAAYLPSNDATP